MGLFKAFSWDSKYIFTRRALSKAKAYKIDRNTIINVLNHYNRVEASKVAGFKNYYKVYKHEEIGVMAKKKGNGKTIVVSAWRYPTFK